MEQESLILLARLWTHACSGFLAPLLAAVVVGGILGLERETHHHPAGLRTLILVSLGAALFTLVGVELGRTAAGDATRIIQGVAGGIGFIGAGVILQSNERVKGLTTAASVWVTGALGVCCGVRFYGMAIFGALLALIVLRCLYRLERRPDVATPGPQPLL